MNTQGTWETAADEPYGPWRTRRQPPMVEKTMKLITHIIPGKGKVVVAVGDYTIGVTSDVFCEC